MTIRRQGTMQSLCREFPAIADQIKAAADRILTAIEENEPLPEPGFTEFRPVGPNLVPREWRLQYSVFAEPIRPGDRIFWLVCDQ